MNKEKLADANGLEAEELETLIEIFQKSAASHRENIRAAIKTNDRELMRQSFHKLAGSGAALLGMGEINSTSRDAETALRAGEEIDAEKILNQIESILRAEGLD